MTDEETPAPSMAAAVLLSLGDISIDHSGVSALTVDSGITSEEDVTLAELSLLIPALLRKLESKVMMHYNVSDIPDGLDFNDAKAMHDAFKARNPSNQYGIRYVPLALLQDVHTLNDKMIVVNYWHGLSKLEQATLFKELQRYYTAPSVSNDQLRCHTQHIDNSTVDQEKCLPLTTEIPFLRGKIMENSVVKYFSHIPDEVCWDNRIGLQHHFKPILGKGVRQIPLALLQDARTDEDRLAIMNWWRGMSVEEQKESFTELKAHYISPSMSNKIIAGPGRYCNQASNNLNEDEEQTFQPSYIYMGSAVFSSPKASSFKRRKTGDSATTNPHLYDRTVRNMEASAQSIVKKINHATSTTVGEGDSEVQARTEQVLISITTVTTPPKAGFNKKKIRFAGRRR
eukprot:scaffold54696_cov60-Attheya_sp.AAC.1